MRPGPLLALVLLLSACATEGDIPLGGRLEVPRAGSAELVEESAAALDAESALGIGEAAYREGDPLTAYSVAHRALSGNVPAELADALRALRSKARAALVTSAVVRVRVVPERDAVVAGESARVRIVFHNRSAADLRVPATLPDSSQAMLVFDLEREDYDVYGNVGRSRIPLRVPLDGDLSVAPGGTTEVSVTLPAATTRFIHQGFAVLTVDGTFRPVLVRVGDTEFFDALPLEPASVRVFMPGYEPLAEDPLASLAKAVEKRSPAHIMTAAELLAPSERREALAILARAAEEDGALAFVLDATSARIKALSGELIDE